LHVRAQGRCTYSAGCCARGRLKLTDLFDQSACGHCKARTLEGQRAAREEQLQREQQQQRQREDHERQQWTEAAALSRAPQNDARDMMEVLEDLNTRSLAGRSLLCLQLCKASASKFVDRLTAAADSMRMAVPDSFRCPITQDVMVDPVIVTETGHTYERSAIEEWLRTHNTDPTTNVQLRSNNLIPNHSLRSSIQEFSANNGAGLPPSP
jgi:hypothetical protein